MANGSAPGGVTPAPAPPPGLCPRRPPRPSSRPSPPSAGSASTLEAGPGGSGSGTGTGRGLAASSPPRQHGKDADTRSRRRQVPPPRFSAPVPRLGSLPGSQSRFPSPVPLFWGGSPFFSPLLSLPGGALPRSVPPRFPRPTGDPRGSTGPRERTPPRPGRCPGPVPSLPVRGSFGSRCGRGYAASTGPPRQLRGRPFGASTGPVPLPRYERSPPNIRGPPSYKGSPSKMRGPHLPPWARGPPGGAGSGPAPGVVSGARLQRAAAGGRGGRGGQSGDAMETPRGPFRWVRPFNQRLS